MHTLVHTSLRTGPDAGGAGDNEGMTEPEGPTTLPVEPDGPAQLPVVPHVPPAYDPELGPYAQWRQDNDRGARLAHDDARLPAEQRTSAEEILAQGYAFWSGYTVHAADLRNAGVIA